MYLKAMNEFSVQEAANMNLSSKFYHYLLDLMKEMGIVANYQEESKEKEKAEQQMAMEF